MIEIQSTMAKLSGIQKSLEGMLAENVARAGSNQTLLRSSFSPDLGGYFLKPLKRQSKLFEADGTKSKPTNFKRLGLFSSAAALATAVSGPKQALHTDLRS